MDQESAPDNGSRQLRPLFTDQEGRQWEFMRDFDDKAVWASEVGSPGNAKLWENPEAVQHIRGAAEIDRRMSELTTQLEEQKTQAEKREQELLADKEGLERTVNEQAETISSLHAIIDELPQRLQKAVQERIKEIEPGSNDKIVRIYSPLTRTFEFAKVIESGEESGERYNRVIAFNDPEQKPQLFFKDELDFWNAGPLDRRSAPPTTLEQAKDRLSGKFRSGKKQLAKLHPKSVVNTSERIGYSLKDKKDRLSEFDFKQYRKRLFGDITGTATVMKELIVGGDEDETDPVDDGRFRLNRHRDDEENPAGPPTDEELRDPKKRVKRVWDLARKLKVQEQDKKAVRLLKYGAIGSLAVGGLFVPGVPQAAFYGGVGYGLYRWGKKKFGDDKEAPTPAPVGTEATTPPDSELENTEEHVADVDGFLGTQMSQLDLRSLLPSEEGEIAYNEIYVETEGGDQYAIMVDDDRLSADGGIPLNAFGVLHGRDLHEVNGDPNRLAFAFTELAPADLTTKRLAVGEPFNFGKERIAKVKEIVCVNSKKFYEPEELRRLSSGRISSVRDDFWALAGLRAANAEELRPTS